MAILTVARQYGSGGREIGQAVAQALGYAYVDKESILEDARATGKKWEQWSKELDEHRPTLWEKYDWSFMGFGALIQWIILNHALRDQVVIMGRGGNFVLHGVPHVLSIHVVAPRESRIERVMHRESVDRETAGWLTEKIDADRARFIQALYSKPWDDPTAYDAVYSTGTQSIEAIAAILVDALKERDTLNTEAAREELQLRVTAAHVKAGIATDPSFFIPTLDVVSDGTRIILRGVIHSPKEHRRVEEAAKRLAGETPIRCELHYRG